MAQLALLLIIEALFSFAFTVAALALLYRVARRRHWHPRLIVDPLRQLAARRRPDGWAHPRVAVAATRKEA